MPSASAHDDLVTVRQAAAMLGVSVRTVERLQADGDLEPVYLATTARAKLRRFRMADIQARIAIANTRVSA